MDKLLKSKAEAQDLIAVRDLKTNKSDTEQCFKCINVMHRMLENLAVLNIEM